MAARHVNRRGFENKRLKYALSIEAALFGPRADAEWQRGVSGSFGLARKPTEM